MKGVILAGGSGTRLQPLTRVTNKHLLPIYNKPVIYYAIEQLVTAGIDRIMIVSSPHHHANFVDLLGSGQDFVSKKTGKQVQIMYGIQNRPSGIADGLWIAKDFVGSENVALHLGDNIIEDDLSSHITNFSKGAKIFLKKVPDPKRFGVASFNKDMRVMEITEKPKKPRTPYAVTGIYLYDNTVFDKIKNIRPSTRGEYEITDVNKAYIKEGTLRAEILYGRWFDVGTIESLFEAALYAKAKQSELNKKKR